MKTTLHIGTAKTGTTSIQHFLVNNRAELRKHRILYPRALGRSTHNALAVLVQGFKPGLNLQLELGIKTAEDWLRLRDESKVALKQECAVVQPLHAIFSSEHICSRCITSAHFETLKKTLHPALNAEELQIVIYLRPQIEQVISLYSTRLRHGLKQDINQFVEAQISNKRYYNYNAMITRWSAAFPQAQMVVRSFKAAQALPHGTVSDFLAITGLAQRLGAQPPPMLRNRSMGGWAAELLRQINLLEDPLQKPVRKTLLNLTCPPVVPRS